ncbi:MAG: DUF3781 domain-containing protein [Oscillospiraceae bacterium]|nr:DUF3781 domain-containing protein [Oscillospiraceae bacterium]
MFITNMDRIHITELGLQRITRNLHLSADDVVDWCKQKIAQPDEIIRKGKNWYVYADNAIITINAHSYTIITAHKVNAEPRKKKNTRIQETHHYRD